MTSSNIPEVYAFELGREWKLSLAELEAVFGVESIERVSEKLVFVRTTLDVRALFWNLGGVVRAMRILMPLRDLKMFPHRVMEVLEETPDEGKISFALGVIGPKFPIFSMGLRIKKDLKAKGKSVRFANKDDKNLVSAVVKKESLAYHEREFFVLECSGETVLAVTTAIQDIDAYAARDLKKERDMDVGMLPPKLAQTMVNLAIGSSLVEGKTTKIGLYDPFCGLGTVLIEGANMGITKLLASDISKEMVDATKVGIERFAEARKIHPDAYTMGLDARNIANFPRLRDVTHIVSEGYLGSVFSQETIAKDKVAAEKKNLISIYEGMFRGLWSAKFTGTIVMTIPCWGIRGEFIYFTEFYDLIKKMGFELQPLLSNRKEIQPTKYGTLLYRRPGQTVGREVCRIVRKSVK